MLLYDYALSFLGVPYIWGGQSYFGVDCGGLAILLTKPFNAAPPIDMTANELYKFYTDKCSATFGALAFFGSSTMIKHVGFCIDDKRMIHAGSGNEWIVNRQKSEASGACVRMDLISYRKDFIGCAMPGYE